MSTHNRRRVQKPHRRRMDRLHALILLALGTVVLLVLALLLRAAARSGRDTAQKPSAFFGLKSIEIQGNTRYREEDILAASGLFIGQNIWTVDKTGAVDKLLSAFSYFETASITNAAWDRLVITVSEASELGAMYAAGRWVVVGTHNKVLQTLEVTDDVPPRLRYFKGATPYPHKEGTAVEPGRFAMDEACFRVAMEIQKALVTYGLTDIGEVDLTERGSIQLDLGGRIRIKLGGESNLAHKLGMVASSLPHIEQTNGVGARGVLDVSIQTEGKSGELGVFTPAG